MRLLCVTAPFSNLLFFGLGGENFLACLCVYKSKLCISNLTKNTKITAHTHCRPGQAGPWPPRRSLR